MRLVTVIAVLTIALGLTACSESKEKGKILNRISMFASNELKIKRDDIKDIVLKDFSFLQNGNIFSYEASGKIIYTSNSGEECKLFKSEDSGQHGMAGGFLAFTVKGKC